MTEDSLSPKIDTTVPHSARIWNYWLGGKDNYPVDQEAGKQFAAVFPGIIDVARVERHFLARAVRFLAGEAGIRQFLDIGTGLPTVDNTHEVAQRTAPDSRVVYVDNDPIVLAHARALLTSTPISMIATMHLIGDGDDPYGIVKQLMAAVPAGSYLALSQVASDVEAEQVAESARRYEQLGRENLRFRSHAEVLRFFEGLELVEPGLVLVPHWRPASVLEARAQSVIWGGVGREP